MTLRRRCPCIHLPTVSRPQRGDAVNATAHSHTTRRAAEALNDTDEDGDDEGAAMVRHHGSVGWLLFFSLRWAEQIRPV